MALNPKITDQGDKVIRHTYVGKHRKLIAA